LTAGYPNPEECVESLLSLEKGGADVIELGNYILALKKR
jgi:tryptophan synthase